MTEGLGSPGSVPMQAGDVFRLVPATRITVIGDIMLDRFISGSVERISPEAPVPVLSRSHQTSMVGGAGNVARNLAHLGARVSLVSVIGDDDAAAALQQALKSEPGISSHLLVDETRPTTQKTRFSAAGQQILRVDDESTHPLAGTITEELLAAVRDAIAGSNAVIISDYRKGVVTAALVKAVTETAHHAGAVLLVDPKQHDAGIYRGANIITPNLGELQRMTGISATDHENIASASRSLLDAHGLDAILTTMGSDGMMLVEREKPVLHLPSSARSVFDVSGAGDTVIAVTAASLGMGAEAELAAKLANIAAGIVVGKAGTATVTPGEVLAQIGRQQALSLDETLTCCKQWKADGAKVVFTNGCFDLLHPGHLWLLDEAARKGQRLVVGINSDASVARLKGPQRPTQPAEQRACALALLPMVDAVTIFEEDTPAQLIAALEPAVLVKGGDYRPDEIVGADLVTTAGGEVCVIPLIDGHSTTAIIARQR